MATASDLIRRALRLIRAIDPGEPPTSHEERDGLVALNAMLDSWNLERQNILVLVSEVFTLSGDGAYTIGPTGTFNTVRPIDIVSVVIGNCVYDQPLTQEDWLEGRPGFYYAPDNPIGTLNVRCLETGEASINSWKPLLGTLKLADSLGLPQGYDRAIAYNLAIEIAPEFGKTASAEVVSIAADSLKNIKRYNAARNAKRASFEDMPVVNRWRDFREG